MQRSTKTPRLFISYSRKDLKKADEITIALRDRYYGKDNVWRDDRIHAGDDWWDKILDNISIANIFVYLLSQKSIDSKVCQSEYDEACRLQRVILPVLIVPKEEVELPKTLAKIHYIDLSEDNKKSDLYEENWNKLIQSIRIQNDRFEEKAPLSEERTPHPISGNIEAENSGKQVTPPNSTDTDDTPDPTQLPPEDIAPDFTYWYSNPMLSTDFIPFQWDEKREAFVERLQAMVSSTEKKHIRLIGRAGVGKTRLALESILRLEWQDACIYAEYPPKVNEISFHNPTDDFPSTLIVDNCSVKDVAQLQWDTQQFDKNLILITIEKFNEVVPTNFDESSIILDALSNDKLSPIVRAIYDKHEIGSIGFNDERGDYADSYIRGNIKLLIAFVDSFLKHNHITGIATLTDVESLHNQLNQLIPDNFTSQRALQGIALINGYPIWHNNELVELVAQWMGLSVSEFKHQRESLIRKGLVVVDSGHRASNYFVVPELFAAHLKAQAWRAVNSDILRFILNLDENDAEQIDFRASLLYGLGDTGERELAENVVRSFLWQDDSFEGIKKISNLIAPLGHTDPFAICKKLSWWTQNASESDLTEFYHQSVVEMLSKAVRFREIVYDAAHILAQFASVETEQWANNATGVWRSIFLLRLGGNPLTGVQRIDLLRELLTSKQPVRLRLVAIQAIEAMLTNRESSWIRPHSIFCRKCGAKATKIVFSPTNSSDNLLLIIMNIRHDQL